MKLVRIVSVRNIKETRSFDGGIIGNVYKVLGSPRTGQKIRTEFGKRYLRYYNFVPVELADLDPSEILDEWL